MARKRDKPQLKGPDWFLREWMKSLNVKQADIVRATDWGKATVSEIVNGKTGYYRQIVNELASVLNIQPWELLMSPEDANQIKRLRAAMDEEVRLRIVAEQRLRYDAEPAGDERLEPNRRARGQ